MPTEVVTFAEGGADTDTTVVVMRTLDYLKLTDVYWQYTAQDLGIEVEEQ